MTSDKLTGLPGLAQFDEDLGRALAERDVVSIALIDIDFFLELNEREGQEAGDRVLRNLAGILPGVAYRVGGDEFGVILAGVSLEEAFLRMETLRGQVESGRAIERVDLPAVRGLTLSIGVAEFPRDAKDPQLLRQAAEAAMLTAKDAGRNRVGLPPTEEMVMKSSYYPATSLRRLKGLAERLGRTESRLLREALDDLLRKYDRRPA